jgi:hypothetical protein
MSSAPRDGSKIIVFWNGRDGQQSQSIAQYRSPDMLERSGLEWDAADVGWWTFIDADTQKRVEPLAWLPKDEDED